MISDNSFSKSWLLAVNKNLGWNRQESQLKNLEKAIAALHLLELLTDTDLEFIFKGGTSLLLLLQRIYRLSVDIDIIVEKPISSTDEVFSNVCSKNGLFTRYERQKRENDTTHSTEHIKFFYNPFADEGEETYILLDLYTSSNPYSKILELELVSDIVETNGKNTSVRVPDVNSILGDKLTAFAPDTIGISLSAEPGHRPKRIEVLKQLYDIGNLFDEADSVASIQTTYNTIAVDEIKRKELNITVTDVLCDSSHHAYVIGHGGKVEKQLYDSIAKGYKDFNKFVSDLSFDETRAVLAASKVAYLAGVLLSGSLILEKYDRYTNMESWIIKDASCLDFNDYKYSNPEAFFYWHKTLSLKLR